MCVNLSTSLGFDQAPEVTKADQGPMYRSHLYTDLPALNRPILETGTLAIGTTRMPSIEEKTRRRWQPGLKNTMSNSYASQPPGFKNISSLNRSIAPGHVTVASYWLSLVAGSVVTGKQWLIESLAATACEFQFNFKAIISLSTTCTLQIVKIPFTHI